MKFLKRNKLDVENDDYLGYLFYSVRNAKALEIVTYIENHFSKTMNLNVLVSFSRETLNIRMFNPKKNQSWEYIDSYCILDYDTIHPISTDSISRFVLKIKRFSASAYLGFKTPKYIEDYWCELTRLFESKEFEIMIAELNYPFDVTKIDGDYTDLKNLSTVFKKVSAFPSDFTQNCVQSGEVAGQKTVVNLVEHLFFLYGFKVDATLSEQCINLTVTNNKRGKWKTATAVIYFKTESKTGYYKDIPQKESKFVKCEILSIDDKETKHFEDFKYYIETKGFADTMEDFLGTMHYPFNAASFLSF